MQDLHISEITQEAIDSFIYLIFNKDYPLKVRLKKLAAIMIIYQS